MQTTGPGQITTFTQSGIPTGASVGVQIISAASGLVALARTTNGIAERPLGSGNYVISFNAPLLGDLYITIVDWNNGVIEPGTSVTGDLVVTAVPQLGSSDLGAIADYASVYLGGETWNAIKSSANFGTTGILRAIGIIKARVQVTPTPPELEGSLPALVLDYLGILTALQLIPAARDIWAQSKISESIGNDPAEIVTYVNRAALVENLQNDLLRRLAAAQAAADPLLDSPTARLVSQGPQIDEDDACYVTEDPRDFPQRDTFPYRHRDVPASSRGRR
jgi:hypothetical protein